MVNLIVVGLSYCHGGRYNHVCGLNLLLLGVFKIERGLGFQASMLCDMNFNTILRYKKNSSLMLHFLFNNVKVF